MAISDLSMSFKSNIISLDRFRSFKKSECDLTYKNRIKQMDRLELLDEMVKFQQERSTTGYLTPKMMVEGIVLFKALEDNAISKELRLLAGSYHRHLQYELEGVRNG
jgi:hypothetical protein